jgi:hypothetical protein
MREWRYFNQAAYLAVASTFVLISILIVSSILPYLLNWQRIQDMNVEMALQTLASASSSVGDTLITEDIIPDGNNTRDIGREDRQYNELWVNTANITGTLDAATGGSAYILAASNAPAQYKYWANAIVSGNADDEFITAYASYDNIQLTPGNYTITNADLVINNGGSLYGCGYTTIINTGNTSYGIDVGNNSSLGNLRIVGYPFSEARSIFCGEIEAKNNCLIENIWQEYTGYGINCDNVANVTVKNHKVNNIKAAVGYGAAFHACDGATNILLDGFNYNHVDRGVELESNVVSHGVSFITVQNGMINDANTTAGATEMSLDVHTHATALSNSTDITLRNINLKNCVRGFTILGTTGGKVQKVTADTIHAENCGLHWFQYVEDSDLKNVMSDGQVGASGYDIEVNHCNNIVVEGCVVNPHHGSTGAVGIVYSEDVNVVNGMFTGNGTSSYGIYTETSNENVLIENNHLFGTYGTRAISATGNYTKILNNYIENDDIWVRSGAENTEVIGNTVLNGTIVDDGTNSLVIGYNGYVTESQGNTTGTGAQQTIAHGCALAPGRDDIMLTAWGNSTWAPYLSSAPSSTNIYITAPNGMPYGWQVRIR